MIFVNSEKDVLNAYIMEGLRRLWEVSVDENGEFANLDYSFNHSPKNGKQVLIPFEDVYCPDYLQLQIINELINEPYCTPSGKVYKLKKSRYEQSIKYNVTLGPSPWSSKKTFIKNHPKFKKIEKKFK